MAAVTASREVPGARVVVAVILLGLVCTALAFTLYYSLIDQIGEERAAIGNYLTPIFALVYGVVLLGESLTISAITGLALIVGGRRSRCAGTARSAPGAKRKPTSTGPTPRFTPEAEREGLFCERASPNGSPGLAGPVFAAV